MKAANQTRAFVVDDDLRSCEVVGTVLETIGMDTHHSTLPDEAAARLQAEKFDIIFVDLHMPGSDGIELTRQVRNSGFNRRTLIVMMTADESPSVLTRGYQAGADFFLFKPLDTAKLMRLVRATEAVIHKEKRRFQRLALSCKVILGQGPGAIEGTTLDVSLGGLLARTEQILAVGTSTPVQLNLIPRQPPLQLKGKVVRVLEDGSLGVEFLPGAPADRSRFQDFLLPQILNVLPREPLRSHGKGR